MQNKAKRNTYPQNKAKQNTYLQNKAKQNTYLPKKAKQNTYWMTILFAWLCFALLSLLYKPFYKRTKKKH